MNLVLKKLSSRAGRIISFSVILPATLFISGCPGKNIVHPVTVTCAPRSDVTSADFGQSRTGNTSLGILNTHQFQPGYVIELIPSQDGNSVGSASHPKTLTTTAADFIPDNPPTTISQVIGSDFTVSGDAEVQAFSTQIQAELKSNTQLKLTGGSRHELKDTMGLLNSNKDVSDYILAHPGRTYMIITGIANGTDLSLQYSTDKSGQANVNVLKIPGTKFTFSVAYNCSNVAELQASGQTPTGLAFFYTTVGVVNGKIDTVQTADLTKYSFINTME